MSDSLSDMLALYDEEAPLEYAYTIPAAWYVDERIAGWSATRFLAATGSLSGERIRPPLRGSSSPSTWLASRSSWSAELMTNSAPFTMCAVITLLRSPPRPAESPSIALPLPWMDLWAGWFAQGHA